MHTYKLRLGLILNSFVIPAWAASAIGQIAHGDSAELSLVALTDYRPRARAGLQGVGIYSVFERIDRALFGRDPDPFRPTNITDLLSGVPQIKMHSVPGKAAWALSEPDISAIQTYGLDIIFRVGCEGLSFDGMCLSRYGVWYYYHGDDLRMTGGPAGFWETVENMPETGTALLAQGGKILPGRVLYRSYFFTYPLSPALHRSRYFWAAASFLPRQIDLLHRVGDEEFWRRTEQFNLPKAGPARHFEKPSGAQAVAAAGKLAGRLLKESIRRLLYLDQWFLLLSLRNNITDGLQTFDVLIPPKDRFWADPHVVQHEDRSYIFVEEFLHARSKGHISVIEMDQSGKWRDPVGILEQPYHLSYPSIFQHEGKYYMVPESSANRTVDLYECVVFPHRWELRETLMRDVIAKDTTLLYHAGFWWLFTAMAEHEAAAPNVELFLFHSERLIGGSWISHPQNPIVSDVKRARPAGAIVRQGARLLRPSQDCSHVYGYGFDLNEIVTLSLSQYCERRIASVRPDWDPKVLGTHTYANAGNLTVVDAFTRVRRIG